MKDTTSDIVKRRWDAAQNLRWRYDWHWEACIRKLAGQHWITWDASRKRLGNMVPKRKDMEFRRTNKIRTEYRRLKALMKKMFPKPICGIGPGDSTAERKRIAVDVGNGLIESWWNDLRMDYVKDQICGSCLAIGSAFQLSGWNTNDPRQSFEILASEQPFTETQDVDVYYCSNCEREYRLNQNPMGPMMCEACGAPVMDTQVYRKPMEVKGSRRPMDAMGNPMMQTITQGEVIAPYVSPLEIFPGRRAHSLYDAGYLFRLRYLPKALVQQYTGEKVSDKDIVPTDISEYHLYDWVLNGITGSVNDYGFSDDDDHEASDLCVFLEYMEEPNKKNKNGLYQIFGDASARKLLVDRTYKEQFDYTDLPFGLVHYQYIPVWGRFWPAGMVEDVFPVNDQLNSEVTQLDYMRSRFLMSKWILFEDSDVDPDRLTGSNDVIKVAGDKDQAPVLVTPAAPVPQLIQGIALTSSRIKDMSMVEESMAGRQPGSVRTTGGINQITEFGMTPLIDIVTDMGYQCRDLFQSLINTAQAKYDDDRVIEIFGSGGLEEYRVFKGSDFKKPGLTVKVETEHLWPMTREEKRDGVTALIQYTRGAFMQFVMSEPEMMQEVLDLYGMSRQNFNATYRRAVRHSELELQKFLENPQQFPLRVDPAVDMHLFHWQHNKKWLSGPEGLALRYDINPETMQMSQQKYNMIRQHSIEHETLYQQSQMQMQLQQQGGGASAPGRPEPSRP